MTARTVVASLTPSDERWSWADRGHCVGHPELFYNDENESKPARRRKEKKAKLLCDSCPVQVECRRHAVENRERYGVWGGLSEAERLRVTGQVRTG